MLGLWCILCRIHNINFFYSIDRVIRKYQYANGNTSLWSALCQYELGVILYFFFLQLHANTISTIDAEPKLNFDLLDRYVTAKLIATASSKSEQRKKTKKINTYIQQIHKHFRSNLFAFVCVFYALQSGSYNHRFTIQRQIS